MICIQRFVVFSSLHYDCDGYFYWKIYRDDGYFLRIFFYFGLSSFCTQLSIILYQYRCGNHSFKICRTKILSILSCWRVVAVIYFIA